MASNAPVQTRRFILTSALLALGLTLCGCGRPPPPASLAENEVANGMTEADLHLRYTTLLSFVNKGDSALEKIGAIQQGYEEQAWESREKGPAYVTNNNEALKDVCNEIVQLMEPFNKEVFNKLGQDCKEVSDLARQVTVGLTTNGYEFNRQWECYSETTISFVYDTFDQKLEPQTITNDYRGYSSQQLQNLVTSLEQLLNIAKRDLCFLSDTEKFQLNGKTLHKIKVEKASCDD